jgi:hypothetical protein
MVFFIGCRLNEYFLWLISFEFQSYQVCRFDFTPNTPKLRDILETFEPRFAALAGHQSPAKFFPASPRRLHASSTCFLSKPNRFRFPSRSDFPCRSPKTFLARISIAGKHFPKKLLTCSHNSQNRRLSNWRAFR